MTCASCRVLIISVVDQEGPFSTESGLSQHWRALHWVKFFLCRSQSKQVKVFSENAEGGVLALERSVLTIRTTTCALKVAILPSQVGKLFCSTCSGRLAGHSPGHSDGWASSAKMASISAE
jgi:hypothetical protein